MDLPGIVPAPVSEQTLIYTDDGEASKCTVVLLRHHNIIFKQVDVTGDAKMIATLSAAGHATLPVVVSGGDVWTGYRPDKIKALARDPLRRAHRRGRSA